MEHLQELVNRTLELNYDGQTNNFPHVLVFFSIALQNKATRILELGVREGGSTYPFLVASKILNGKTTSIDIKEPIFKCPENLKPHWNFYKADAITFLTNIKGVEYDIIYVDDWHSYEHVRTELSLIEKISTPSTLILLHDAMPNSAPHYSLTYNQGEEFGNGGVARALLELDNNIWEYATLPINHGLTILRKKGEIQQK